METIRRDQCCNRKCLWVGIDKAKNLRDDGDNEYGIGVETMVCPDCGGQTFYEATERQYQNYLKRVAR